MSSAFFNSTEHDTHAAGFDYDLYQREYRRNNPDKVKQWRVTQAANMLRKLGWTVLPPKDNTTESEGGAAE